MISDFLVPGGDWSSLVLSLSKCAVVKSDKAHVWFFSSVFADTSAIAMVASIFEGNVEESPSLCEEYTGDEDSGLHYNHKNHKHVLQTKKQ